MQLEEKGKEMTDKLKGAIDELNQEASALEVEKEKKEVNAGFFFFRASHLCGRWLCMLVIPSLSVLSTAL